MKNHPNTAEARMLPKLPQRDLTRAMAMFADDPAGYMRCSGTVKALSHSGGGGGGGGGNGKSGGAHDDDPREEDGGGGGRSSRHQSDNAGNTDSSEDSIQISNVQVLIENSMAFDLGLIGHSNKGGMALPQSVTMHNGPPNLDVLANNDVVG